MLSSSAIHTIRAMIALASLPEGACEGAHSLAERVEAPPNYLGKLLPILAGAELVVSRKGRGGGWSLAQDPADISLFDILKPIESTESWYSCFLGRADCSDQNPCHVHHAWAPVRDGFLTFLHSTTLQQLLDEGGVERLEAFLKD